MTPHEKRMREARRNRRLNGLPELFSIQTDLRNELSEINRLLRDLKQYQIAEDRRSILKEWVQKWSADDAEAIYRLTAPEN